MKKLILILVVSFFIQISFSQWVHTLNGISMWSLGKNLSGHVYAGTSGTIRSIYKTTNYGTSWDTVLSGGVTNFLFIACDSGNTVCAANGSNGLMKSTNNGANWTNISSSTFNNKNVQSVVCGKSGYVYVGTITGGIFRSTDNGTTFPDNTLTTLTIVTLAVDKYNSNIIYAGASSGSPPNYGFYRSTDAGTTWSSNLNPLNIWGIVQKPWGIFTITTSSPYPYDKSTNGGLNWTTVSNLPGAMRGITLDLPDNYVYTSGNGGVFRSTNDGTSFTNWDLTYSANQIVNVSNRIFVAVSGTTNGGVYWRSYPLGIKQINNNVPENFALYQNYPNPFNPNTKIRFSLPSPSEGGVQAVKLVIYDVLGREVTSLIPPLWGGKEGLQPGTYEAEWDASYYPSGVYFYMLAAGDYTETKKMIMVK